MPLDNYRLRPPSTVILADGRDPYISWQNHLDRTDGLRGGVDLVAPVGTPVYARTDGRMIQIPNDGSAGNSCRFYHASNSGWKDVFSHLSSYRTPKNPSGLNAFDYKAGDIVAYTGNTGGVAPHLHWHLLDPNGNRQNPWNYFSGSELSGGDYIEIKGFLDMLSDNQQIELLHKTRAIYDALFKLTPISGSTTGGNPMPGGLLRMASINFDATVQVRGEGGASRDGTLPALEKIEKHLGIIEDAASE